MLKKRNQKKLSKLIASFGLLCVRDGLAAFIGWPLSQDYRPKSADFSSKNKTPTHNASATIDGICHSVPAILLSRCPNPTTTVWNDPPNERKRFRGSKGQTTDSTIGSRRAQQNRETRAHLTRQHDQYDRNGILNGRLPRVDGGHGVLGVGFAAGAIAERHGRIAHLPQQHIVLGESGYGQRNAVQDRDDFQRSVAHFDVRWKNRAGGEKKKIRKPTNGR